MKRTCAIVKYLGYRTRTHCYQPIGRSHWFHLISKQTTWHFQLNRVDERDLSHNYGVGADISLPHCLATASYQNFGSKIITRPKSRKTSFDTTFWRYVQRYCAHFRLFYANVPRVLFRAGPSFLGLIYSIPSNNWNELQFAFLLRINLSVWWRLAICGRNVAITIKRRHRAANENTSLLLY